MFKGDHRTYTFHYVDLQSLTIVCCDSSGGERSFRAEQLKGPVLKRSYRIKKEVQ
jgi:hypothetical protein